MANDQSLLEDHKSNLHKFVETKGARLREIVAAVKGTGAEGDPFTLETGMAAEFKAVKAELAEAKDLLDGLALATETEATVKFLEAPESKSVAAMLAAQGAIPEAKTVGRQFVESEEFKSMMRAGLLTMDKKFLVPSGGFWTPETKDLYSALPTGTPGTFGAVQRDPIVPRAHRQFRVRDLFNMVQTTAAVIEFFRVTGFTNNAAPVQERLDNNSGFYPKPKSTLSFKGDQVSVRTLAHWEAAHRNVLSDEPVLQGIVENELLYGLALVEDDQILNGTGTGNDLLGIRNVDGIQSYSQSSGQPTDNKADALRRAMTLALLAYYQPTGVVLHDGDWEDIELAKDDQGRYLMAVSIALGGEQRVWRVPVVTTPAMEEGFALVGAFGVGATLYDREQSTIRVSEHHANFFVENAVAILAEERLALATKRPESFVEVEFDGPPEP